MTTRQRERQKRRDLITACKALDEGMIGKLIKKYRIPPPPDGWVPHSYLVIMHTMRISLKQFTLEEKEVSRQWFEDNYKVSWPKREKEL